MEHLLGDLPDLLWDDETDVVGWITAMAVDGPGRRLTLSLDLRGAAGFTARRTVECESALRWSLSDEAIYRCGVSADHPALLEFTDQRADLYFTGAPADPVQMADHLRGVYARLAEPYIPFVDVANRAQGSIAALLEGGRGKLAGNGPASVLRELEVVLGTGGVKTSLLVTGPPKYYDEQEEAWLPAPTGLSVLQLDASWIVAKRFTVRSEDSDV